MGWLEDLANDTVFKYVAQNDEENYVLGTTAELAELFGTQVQGEPGEVVSQTVEDDEGVQSVIDWKYAGFEPRKLSLMTKVVFEKNGRQAVKISDSSGKHVYRSMTRENLLKGKGVKETGKRRDGRPQLEVQSSLTKRCAEASTKVKKEIAHTQMKAVNRYIEKMSAERRKK